MLSAQLNRKVPFEFEGLEDVLTSSVFTLPRYLRAQLAGRLMTQWAEIPKQQQPEVEFWPRYATPSGFHTLIGEDRPDRGDTEPDVVIRTQEWLVLVDEVPSIGFLKVVFREGGVIECPEVRFGLLTEVEKPSRRAATWPRKFGDVASHLAERAIVDSSWIDPENIPQKYEHPCVSLRIDGRGVSLVKITDSQTIAEHIADPLLAMFRDAVG